MRAYDHRPQQIEQQIADLSTDLYAYVPSRLLAQRNMEVMNKMGLHVMSRLSDQLRNRSWRVREPSLPPGPFAVYLIEGYVELTAPQHNNLQGVRFVDRPERSDAGMA